jgi:hypothetical protein
MKIGILTFHKAHNYGAVLQAYALKITLESLGHEVMFINHSGAADRMPAYRVFYYRRFFSKTPKLVFKKIITEVRLLKSRYRRKINFNSFISKEFNLDNNENISYLNEKYDFIVIGSDQVWNTALTNGFDKYYWGALKIQNSRLKIISYAASMESSNLQQSEEIKIRKYLKNFDALSVRENSLKILLGQYVNKEISVVLDPTLLLNVNEWDKLVQIPIIKKPYLLLYQVRNSEENVEISKRIARKLNLDIVYLSAKVEEVNSEQCISASPYEFLGWLKCADFVVCSSFHGVVFSILFRRQFYSIRMNDGRDSRVLSLLKSLNLEDRSISNNDYFDCDNIDWNAIDEKKGEIRLESIEYLKRALL